jgi:hypothetical protein
MKTHRPWQPHMGSAPLFNPYVPPTGRDMMLDHVDLAEEQESEAEPSAELQSPDPLQTQPAAKQS